MFLNFAAGYTEPAHLILQEEGGGFLSLPPALGLVAVLFLVLANGFFAAAEFALVAVRRSRIEQLADRGHATAPAVLKALDNLDAYVAASQLGITMASLGLGWVGEPALEGILDPLLDFLPEEGQFITSHLISVIIAFSIITALHIILGEFAPKGFALQRAEAVALFVAVPMRVFLTVFRPIINLFNGMGNVILRLIGLEAGTGEGSVARSVEELRYLLESSREAGVLESAEEEIAGRAFTLGEVSAHSVMTPRTEMVSVPIDISLDELFDLVGLERHVRFPVYKGNRDTIAGILHLTDVLDWERTHPGEPWSVEASMRPALMVPESVKGDRLLAQMRSAGTHMAVVVDEFGGVAGVVTLQDLLERIVGEVPELDEGDVPEIEMLPDGSVRVDGLTPLDEVRDRFALKLQNGDAETVGGYVLETLGRVPQVGEEIDLESYRLEVSEMDGPRVAQVLLRK
jgi:putative hemolysin